LNSQQQATNKTHVVCQSKSLNVGDYAVSSSMIQSKTERSCTGGGAAMGRRAVPSSALDFSLLLSLCQDKESRVTVN